MARQFLNGEITTTLTVSGLSILGGGQQVKARTIAASGSLTSADYVAYCNASGAITLTLPASAGNGQSFIIINVGANIVTIAPAGTDSIGTSASATSITIPQYGAVTLIDASVLGKWAQLLELPEIWNRFSLGTTGGAANTQTGSYPLGQIPTSYVSGMMAQFVAGFSNTAAITLNINALGVKNIYSAGSPCVGNEIVAGRTYIVVYDGSQFELINSSNTLATFGNVAPNLVLAGPASGASAIPTARTLVVTDIPSLPASQITTGQLSPVNGGTGLSSAVLGNIACGSGANTMAMIAPNTSALRQVLAMTGTGTVGAAATWASLSAADIISGQLLPARGGTGTDFSVTGGYGYTVTQTITGAPLDSRPLQSGEIPFSPAIQQFSGYMVANGSALSTSSDGGPSSVAMDASERFLYTFCTSTNNVLCHQVNPDGSLTYLYGSSHGGGIPTSGPDPRFIYFGNTPWLINPSTGVLTAITSGPAAAGLFTIIEPKGRFLYHNSNGATFQANKINETTGVVTVVGSAVTPTGSNFLAAMAVEATGNYLYLLDSATSIFCYSINQTTGAVTALTTFTTVGGSVALTTDKRGKFLFYSNASVIYSCAIGSSGTLSAVMNIAGPTGSLYVDASGLFLIAIGSTGNAIYSIGPTGILSLVAQPSLGTCASSSYPNTCALSPSNRFFFQSNTSGSYIQAFKLTVPVKVNVISPATVANCMQIGPGATSYTVTAVSGTPIAIPGLLPTAGGFLLVTCSNGDQAVLGLPIGGTVGVCVLTWSTGTSLAVTTPATGKWSIDYSGGWRVNNQVGTAGTSTLSYVCVLVGGP